MKISSALVLSFLSANLSGSCAFVVNARKAPSLVLKMGDATPLPEDEYMPIPAEDFGPPLDPEVVPDTLPNMVKIEGGNSLRTYKMPQGCDRVQVVLKTNGRPMKALIELWCGPIRRTHMCDIDMQDGAKTPFRELLKFKNTDSAGPMVLRIGTKESFEFPVLAGVNPLTPEQSAEANAFTEEVWETRGIKTYSQGAKTIRKVPIPAGVEAVQLVVWARDVGKKSFRAKIELLQGPNNVKQQYTLQCGGGSQPYHAILQTPGPGWALRLTNLKNLEDGAFEFCVAPYQSDIPMIDDGKPVIDASSFEPSEKSWWDR